MEALTFSELCNLKVGDRLYEVDAYGTIYFEVFTEPFVTFGSCVSWAALDKEDDVVIKYRVNRYTDPIKIYRQRA